MSTKISIKEIFYKPSNASLGDVIPFYEDGEFRLFYLHDKRKWYENRNPTWPIGPISWYQIGTTDFLNFSEYGEAIPTGSDKDQDYYIYTGSVIKAENHYHIFYTGHNPQFVKKNKNQDAIMHAISKDLVNWKKVPEDTFYADQKIYEKNDWDSPFVFWNSEANEYWMLICARIKSAPPRRRGCIGLCTSKDLKNWTASEPFWSPNIYYRMECADLFKIGKWYYLLFSTFSEDCVTHYRMSKSVNGPWILPKNDTFDGRAYYAAKTATDGKRRFLFGWNPTKTPMQDCESKWNWGGNLIVHEIIQNSHGELFIKVPDTINNVFEKKIDFTLYPLLGNWNITKKTISVDSRDSFSCAVSNCNMPLTCKISIKVKYIKNTKNFGLILRLGDDQDSAYYIRFEPLRNRMVFDLWPRTKIFPSTNHDSFLPGLERPLDFKKQTFYHIKVFVDKTICVVYVNKQLALSTRIYNLNVGKWGLFVSEGSAVFYEPEIYCLNNKN